MDIVVTEKNTPQIVQAMCENVKSNQHRLDEIEPVLTKIAIQIDRMDGLLVRNGFAKAVESNAKDLKEFKGSFQGFLLNREDSCPVTKRTAEESTQIDRQRSWHFTLIRVIGTVIGTVSTAIIIIEKAIQ